MALVVAAGSGRRAGGERPKQYRPIAGRAVLLHAVDHLRHPGIAAVRVVIAPNQEALYRDVMGSTAPPPVFGGETRRESVRNGLQAIEAEGGASAVLIHDAARPFLPGAVVDRLLAALADHPGAVPVLPVVDTLARGDGALGDAISRDGLLRVQTPQAFRFTDILDAHARWTEGAEATDDAQVARAAGLSVAVVAGDEMLSKITHDEDFDRAERRIEATMVSRTGLGFDVHAFADGEELWIGGIRIAHNRGLAGHSDADVALHALTDALLGAVGAGDIGDHFPPSDPQWRGARSALFVEHARDLIERRGGRIDHADLTIICEAPKIGPHKEAIRRTVASLLRVPEASINIKATTTERLGFAGRGEGIAAQAVATVRLPERS